MVEHLEVPTIEPQKGLPSSLSRKVVSGLLVNDLGFQGLVFTDALAMKGVSGNESICLQALKAGNDLLLVPFFHSGKHSLHFFLNTPGDKQRKR